MQTLTEAPKPTVHFERYLTLDDLAEITAMSKPTLYTWRTTHPEKLPRAIKIGRSLRFHPDEVHRWLDELTAAQFADRAV